MNSLSNQIRATLSDTEKSNLLDEICFISTVHQIYDTRIYYKEIMSLVNNGYVVNYIVKKDQIIDDHPNIRFSFLPNKSGIWNRIKNIFRAIKLANRIDNRIYHFHDPELIFAGLYLKFFRKKIVIYDIHELYHDELKYKPYLIKAFSFIISYIYIIIDRFATKIFDTNILAEEKYLDHYTGNNFIVIQNYILSKYVVNDDSIPDRISDKIQIVYVGSIRDVRGINEMMDLLILLKQYINFNFHLIGSYTPAGLENKVQHIIDEHDLTDCIRIYGRLLFPEAQKIVRKCDVGLLFLHPIVNNLTILATKMFEYMGNGLAVMMTNFPLWIEFNNKYKCGITIDIFNLERELSRIKDFLEDDKSLNLIKLSNIKTVRENFTWDIEEKKLLQIYNDLTKSELT